MSDFRARLFDEQTDLHLKIEKLEKFILSDKYDTLPQVDRKDLKEQLGHMKAYHTVIMRRCSRQCNNA